MPNLPVPLRSGDDFRGGVVRTINAIIEYLRQTRLVADNRTTVITQGVAGQVVCAIQPPPSAPPPSATTTVQIAPAGNRPFIMISAEDVIPSSSSSSSSSGSSSSSSSSAQYKWFGVTGGEIHNIVSWDNTLQSPVFEPAYGLGATTIDTSTLPANTYYLLATRNGYRVRTSSDENLVNYGLPGYFEYLMDYCKQNT